MVLVEWRDAFKTGIDDVDFEHEEMIRLINEAHAHIQADAPAEEVADFLGEVYTRISGHFALEEAIMRDHKYDMFDAHKADHERLLDAIRDIMEAQAAGDFGAMSEDLSRRLETWFVDHFKTQDSRLHRLLG